MESPREGGPFWADDAKRCTSAERRRAGYGALYTSRTARCCSAALAPSILGRAGQPRASRGEEAATWVRDTALRSHRTSHQVPPTPQVTRLLRLLAHLLRSTSHLPLLSRYCRCVLLQWAQRVLALVGVPCLTCAVSSPSAQRQHGVTCAPLLRSLHALHEPQMLRCVSPPLMKGRLRRGSVVTALLRAPSIPLRTARRTAQLKYEPHCERFLWLRQRESLPLQPGRSGRWRLSRPASHCARFYRLAAHSHGLDTFAGALCSVACGATLSLRGGKAPPSLQILPALLRFSHASPQTFC